MDALPYPAFQLEISGFSYGSIRERRSLAPLRPTYAAAESGGSTEWALYETATRKQGALRGFKGFLPLEQLE